MAFYWNFSKLIQTGRTFKVSDEQLLLVWQWGEAVFDHMPAEFAFDFSIDRKIQIIVIQN